MVMNSAMNSWIQRLLVRESAKNCSGSGTTHQRQVNDALTRSRTAISETTSIFRQQALERERELQRLANARRSTSSNAKAMCLYFFSAAEQRFYVSTRPDQRPYIKIFLYKVFGPDWRAGHNVLNLSLLSSVRLLPIVWTWYFEKKWTDFGVNLHKWSNDKGTKQSTLGSRGQRLRSHKAEDRCGSLDFVESIVF